MENIAGSLIGSVFVIFSMPLTGITLIQFYIFSGVSGHNILSEFSETLPMILGIVIIPGTIMGGISVNIAKKKITLPVESTI